VETSLEGAAEHPALGRGEGAHRREILANARRRRFRTREVVFHEGDPADHFYLVREGLVSVQLVVPHDGLTTVMTVSNGEVLGWSWLFPPYRWHFDARVQKPTHALAFDGKCLRDKFDQDHSLGYEIYKRFMKIVSERLESTRLQLLDMYGNHA